MAVDPANIKFYQCNIWAEGETHGGVINTGSEITSGADQNIFDDVTDAERVAGVAGTEPTAYRKVYIRNENADTWNGVKCWIDTFTPATNDEVSIVAGTTSDVVSEIKEGGSGPLTFVSPNAKGHGDVLVLGDMAENVSKAIWVKRTVSAAGSGYTNNNFKLAFESS